MKKVFWKKLNETEKRHLRKSGIVNIAIFKRTREIQNSYAKESNKPTIAICNTCTRIARKTGIGE